MVDDPYAWTECYHPMASHPGGRFRWRRHPELYDLFMEDPQNERFWTPPVEVGGHTFGPIYYPAIWEVQWWGEEPTDDEGWGPTYQRVELPGMD